MNEQVKARIVARLVKRHPYCQVCVLLRRPEGPNRSEGLAHVQYGKGYRYMVTCGEHVRDMEHAWGPIPDVSKGSRRFFGMTTHEYVSMGLWHIEEWLGRR